MGISFLPGVYTVAMSLDWQKVFDAAKDHLLKSVTEPGGSKKKTVRGGGQGFVCPWDDYSVSSKTKKEFVAHMMSHQKVALASNPDLTEAQYDKVVDDLAEYAKYRTEANRNSPAKKLDDVKDKFADLIKKYSIAVKPEPVEAKDDEKKAAAPVPTKEELETKAIDEAEKKRVEESLKPKPGPGIADVMKLMQMNAPSQPTEVGTLGEATVATIKKKRASRASKASKKGIDELVSVMDASKLDSIPKAIKKPRKKLVIKSVKKCKKDICCGEAQKAAPL